MRRIRKRHSTPGRIILDPWAGLPIALISSDFTFMTKDRLVMTFQEATTQATYVTIRFSFDKAGGQNFNSRTFRSITSQHFLCPVKTSIRLLERWNTLGAIDNYPICCYKPFAKKKKRDNQQPVISDRDVTLNLRQAVMDAYPDPQHICRKTLIISVHNQSEFSRAALLLQQAYLMPKSNSNSVGAQPLGKLTSENCQERRMQQQSNGSSLR